MFPRLTAAGLMVALSACAPAADPKPRVAIADPAEAAADPDFAVQGEYEGTTAEGGREVKVGAQVVARGNGRFDVRLLPGGLPGAGWDGKAVKAATAGRDGDKVTVKGVDPADDLGAIAGGVMTLRHGDATATLRKVERESPTLGAEPPKGATVLYAGPDDVGNWKGGKTAKLSDGEFLAAMSNPRSVAKFQGATIHLEFRLAWMPASTGQARSNSGAYVQERYEVQVLDSFGLKGLDNECGGIYRESAPKVNMCFPPMRWQTYDIDFTPAGFDGDGKKTSPAVVTVRHNGVVIHDKLELKGPTPGGGIDKETPLPGSLYLQNHGDPVVYRNVWVAEKE